MTIAVRIFQWMTGLAGLGALILGLLYWTANMSFISLHMLFGFTVTLALLRLRILMLFNSRMRIWGVVGIVYALIIPALGLTQITLLVGNVHWLIRTLHMLVGLGTGGGCRPSGLHARICSPSLGSSHPEPNVCEIDI